MCEDSKKEMCVCVRARVESPLSYSKATKCTVKQLKGKRIKHLTEDCFMWSQLKLFFHMLHQLT